MILVPEEMYRGMLSSNETLGNTARVFAAKQEAGSILRSRKKPPGVRRVLYEKKMRDFLKLRQEAVDRPVKVEISRPPVAKHSKPFDDVATAWVGKQRKRKAAKRTGDNAPPGGSMPPEGFYTPPNPPPTGDEGSAPPPPPKKGRSSSAPHSTPKTSRRRVLEQKGAEKQGSIDEHVKKVIDYVSQNRAKFGVSDAGRVLGPNNAEVKHSNIEDVVKSLVQPVYKAGGSPPGTSYIRSRLMKDKEAAEMIKRAMEHGRTQYGMGHTVSQRTFKPALWKRS